MYPSFPAHAAEPIARIIKVINEHVKCMSPPSISVARLETSSLRPITSSETCITTFEGTHYSCARLYGVKIRLGCGRRRSKH